MSISGAVAELDKEIAGLNKEVERLTQIRESLLQGASKSAARVSATALPAPAKRPGPKKKPGPEKSTVVKKSIAVKKPVALKKSAPTKTAAPGAKRVVSEATRKKMSDAAKARAARKASAA
jgi:hypothetical protein